MVRSALFKDRLKEAMLVRGIKSVELHRRTGISESTISQYRSGYAEPKKQKLDELASALNVSPAWLMGLDVEMGFYQRHSAKPAKPTNNKKSDLQTAYDQADEKTKKAVRVLLGLE